MAYLLSRTPPSPPVAPTLDEAQRAVVDHTGGPLLVLAGPGTGKTTTLVEAVVDRVERRGLKPDEVLVLTFSRKAAAELRDRIAARLGRTVREPAAWTFHAWCYALVRAQAPSGETAPRLLSGAERLVRVQELLAGNLAGEGRTRWPEALQPALGTRGFAAELSDLLDRARERGLDASALARLGAQQNKPGWVSAASFLDEYADVLDFSGVLDYAELVSRALAIAERPEVRAELRARYAAVFVDEYQDTDPAQERLLHAVAGDGRDLIAFGDPDQAIYGFRGAEVGCLLGFPQRFPQRTGKPAPIHALAVSRRSGPELRAVAARLAVTLPAPGLQAAKLKAHRELTSADGLPPGSLSVRRYRTGAEEAVAIADLLRRAHLEDGMPWSDMAVLVRSGVRSIPVLRRTLTAAGVPVAVASDELPIARDPAVVPLLDVLRVAADPAALTPARAHALLVSPLGGAQTAALRQLGRRLRDIDRTAGNAVPRPSALLIRDAVADPRDLVLVEDRVAAPVLRITKLIDQARAVLAREGGVDEALWAVWDGSGWSRELAAHARAGGAAARSADRDLDAVLALFAAVERYADRVPKAGVATLLAEIEAQEIPGRPREEGPDRRDAVRLLTTHRAKGLEWRLVVVASVQEGAWPDLRRRGSLLEAELLGPDDELRAAPTVQSLLVEERRLFYVAVTRAKERLVVTAVESVDEAGERPSRFLDELRVPIDDASVGGTALLSPGSLVARLRRALTSEDQSLPVRVDAAALLAELALATAPDGSAYVPAADPTSWWGMREVTGGDRPVRPADQPVRLSGSTVRSYDLCPLSWFLESEVGARGPSTAAQGFGNVVHALARRVVEDPPPDVDELMAELDRVWGSIGFESPWEATAERASARAAIERLLDWHTKNSRTLLAVEAPFDITTEHLTLRGVVDRLELDADGRVHVVDLKTGRTPPSKEKAEQDRQLAVYQLAVQGRAFPEHTESNQPGGAELVFLREGMKDGQPVVRGQAALADSWAADLVATVAVGIAAEAFPARVHDGCGHCAFLSCCPAQEAGRPVIR